MKGIGWRRWNGGNGIEGMGLRDVMEGWDGGMAGRDGMEGWQGGDGIEGIGWRG